MSENSTSDATRSAWLFLAPALILMFIFTVAPAMFSLLLSFHDFKPFSFTLVPVGLDQYMELAGSEDYRASLMATLRFAALVVPGAGLGSLAVAVLLDQMPFFRSIFRTIFLIPVGISPAMAAMLWVFLFNPTSGFLNYLLSTVGIAGPAWLSDPDWAPFAVSLTTVWKEVGFNIIFLMAALAQVPMPSGDSGISPCQAFPRQCFL